MLGPLDPLRALAAVRAAGARLVRAIRADHMTLNQRSLRSYAGPTSHACLHAAVAPSRRIRPTPTDEFGERAAALAGALGLPTIPHRAGTDSQRFAQIDASGTPTHSLVVTRSGVLELLWALEEVPTDDGAWAVRALDPCTQLARFAGLVGGNDYAHVLAASRWRRARHSRVDWILGVTTTTGGIDGTHGWRDIHVVGPQPDRASGHTHAFMEPAGYGTQLRGIKRSHARADIVRVLLTDWLHANGYLRTASAVEATVSAAVAACK